MISSYLPDAFLNALSSVYPLCLNYYYRNAIYQEYCITAISKLAIGILPFIRNLKLIILNIIKINKPDVKLPFVLVRIN